VGSHRALLPLAAAGLVCALAGCASLTSGRAEVVLWDENGLVPLAAAIGRTWSLDSIVIRRPLTEPTLEAELAELLLILTKKYGVALLAPAQSQPTTPRLLVVVIERPFTRGIDTLFSIAVTLSLERQNGEPLAKSLFVEDGVSSLASYQTLAAVVERPLVELLRRLDEVARTAGG
jgi:hypothetical protein